MEKKTRNGPHRPGSLPPPGERSCSVCTAVYRRRPCSGAAGWLTAYICLRRGKFFAGQTSLDIAVSGRKVYFFPPPLNKGTAVKRLKERFQPEKTICAGDSVIDIPMLRAADLAILPNPDLLQDGNSAVLKIHQGTDRFPDFVLQSVMEILK